MTDEELEVALSDPHTAPEAVARLLDNAATATHGLHEIDTEVRGLVRRAESIGLSDGVPGVQLLRRGLDAIAYRLSFDSGRCSFLPYLELADGETHPARVEVQSDDAVDGWRALLQHVSEAAWVSRLAHLVVATDKLEGRQRVETARSAIAAYLDVQTRWGLGLDAVDALHAALSLTKAFRLRNAQQEVVAALVAATETALSDPQPKAGIVVGLTQILVDMRNAPPETDALLAEARRVFAGDPHNTDHVIAQQLAHADDDAKRGELWAERVQVWLDAATATGDVRRAKFLETAVEHANKSGDARLRELATVQLQGLTLRDLQLRGIRTGMVLRGEQIAEAVRGVTDAATWHDALDAFARFGPPTGDAEENRRRVDEHSREFALSRLFPVTQYGSDGLPRFNADTDEARQEYELTRQETFQLQISRHLVAEALLRFPKHHELPSYEELVNYFLRNALVDQDLAAALARGFLRWWGGDYEGAGFTIVPRIETLARNLLLAVDAPLYRLQRSTAPGQYPGLGFLLEQLVRYGYPDSWYRYLFTLLANPTGWNARNELAHGFLDDLDLVTSALFLHAAANLAATGPAAPSAGPAES